MNNLESLYASLMPNNQTYHYNQFGRLVPDTAMDEYIGPHYDQNGNRLPEPNF